MSAEKISRYPVLRPLGSGGMGEVYLARDPELDREVALKVLHSDAGDRDEALARLRGEARAVAALRHPNIVTVYEIGADSDRAFIAMEYIDGGSLKDRLDGGSMAPAELLEIGARVARALEAAHAAGVLHRDIKPDNVMLERGGGVKVVDFGIAHRLDAHPPVVSGEAITGRIDAVAATIAETLPRGDHQATAQTIFGTPAYMAPEVVCGERPLPESDVYGLGVTLYEGLAGHLPYRGGGVLEVVTRVADPEVGFEPLAATRPDLDPEIVALVESMLAHDPTARPTAAEVAARLETLTAPTTEPVEVVRTVTRPAPRPFFPWVIAVGTLAIAAVAIALLWRSSADPEAPSTATAPRDPIKLAIAGVEGDYQSVGNSQFTPAGVARVVARVLDTTDAIVPVVLDPEEGPPLQVARDKGASLLLTAQLARGGDGASGRYDLVDVASGETRHGGEIAGPDLAAVIADLSRAVLVQLDIEHGEGWEQTTARVSFELGLAAYRRLQWPTARLFFEQAVRADPDFPGAWFYLAWALGWSGAPAEATTHAGQRALETARTDLERGLARAVSLYNRRKYRQAAEVLDPLLAKHGRDRDLLYTYAEALFHDGQIAGALDYFDRCLEVAPRFQPASLHPSQVAAARKDASAYRRYRLLAGKPYEGMVAYLSGDSSPAAARGIGEWQLELVEGNYGERDRALADRRTARALAYIAGRAAQLGTRSAARARFETLWPELSEAATEPRGAFGLQILSRALIIGGYAEEVEVVRQWWGKNKAPVNLMARQELSVYAAPLLDRPLPPRDQLTTRLGRVADGIEAGRAGDHERAADILAELAARPTGRGADYLLWHASARALAAAGRTEKLRESCRAWRRPGFVDDSIVALWAYCDEALR